MALAATIRWTAAQATILSVAEQSTIHSMAAPARIRQFLGGVLGIQVQLQLWHITVRDTPTGDGDDRTDSVVHIATLSFANRAITLPDLLRYIASDGDVIMAFGANADAGMQHYLDWGINDGVRSPSMQHCIWPRTPT